MANLFAMDAMGSKSGGPEAGGVLGNNIRDGESCRIPPHVHLPHPQEATVSGFGSQGCGWGCGPEVSCDHQAC